MRAFAGVIVVVGMALALLFLSTLVVERACASGCGILPIKPIPPLGCSDLCPQCQCDTQGQNCRWVWICC